MANNTVARILAGQFDHAWDALAQAVANFPAEGYARSDCDWLAPTRLAYHAVETAEYMTLPDPEQGGPPLDWDNGPANALPDQPQLLAYLGRVRQQVRQWLEGLDDAALLAPDVAFKGEFGLTHLDRALYALRHTQHHLGQLNAELRRRGLPRAAWA